MSFASIDDVCLFQLFKYIPFRELFSLRILNKRFYYLVNEYLQSIRHVEFNYNDEGDEMVIKQANNQLLKIGNRLNVFKFKELNKFSNLIRSNFFYFENLITLKLINLELNDIAFDYLIQQPFIGTTLEIIEIHKCNFQFKRSNELTYWDQFLKKAGRTLKSLVLIKNQMTNSYLLDKIAFYCRNLNTLSLDLNQFYHLNDFYVHRLISDFTEIAIVNLHLFGTKKEFFNGNIGKIINYERIQILTLDCVPISNTHLIHVFNQLTNIRILKFVLNSNHRNIDDFYTELAYSIASRQFLEQLHLLESREFVLIDELFQTLIPLMNNRLKVLEIQNSLLNDCTLELICNSLTNLNALFINSFTTSIFGNFYFSFTLSKRMKRNNLITNLTKLTNLTRLNLIYTIITDAEFCELLDEFNGNLTFLSLEGCLELSIKSVQKLCDQAFANSNKKYCLELSNDLYKQIENSPIQCLPNNLIISKNTNVRKYNKLN